MQIVEMPIADIKPYARNPRKNEAAVEVVANSIKEFGFTNPILVDARNVVIAGHTRLKAAKSLKLTTVPVIVADLPSDRAKALRIMDNRAGDYSAWDYPLLIEEIDELGQDWAELLGLSDLDALIGDFDNILDVTKETEANMGLGHCLIVVLDDEKKLGKVAEQITEIKGVVDVRKHQY